MALDRAGEKPVAQFRPGTFRPIRLYADGWLSSPWGSGSVAGASAHVDESGNRKLFRDFRGAYLTIEGPELAIARRLDVKHYGPAIVVRARRFAAEVNRAAQRV